HQRKFKSTRSVYVRAWDEIESMPAFFAMVRGIERRFGRLREFRMGRDYDISTKYTTFFIADFEDEESYYRVPEKGASVKVEVPVSPRNRPGGVGLDEIQALLPSQDWDPDAASGEGIYSAPIKPLQDFTEAEPRQTRVVELLVQRSKSDATEFRHRRRIKESAQFGIAFYRWGGFYQPKPDDPVEVSTDMKRMLGKWAPVAERAAKSPSKPAAIGEELRDEVEERLLEQHLAEDDAPLQRELAADGQRAEEAPYSAETSMDAATTAAAADSTSTPQQPTRLSQREKILMRARQHAKTPLPDLSSQAAEAEKQKEAEEKAQEQGQQKAVVSRLREQVLKLMGNWS
ncbi:hypothetical protein OH77DRAFT_1367415, partial [Trametes cingulata]